MRICPVTITMKSTMACFVACLFLVCLTSLSPLVFAGQNILNKQAVENAFRKKLISYQDMIAEERIDELQQAVRDLTHDKTIVLFEFSLKLPDDEPTAAQRAYFNRDPFIDLLKNAKILDKKSFKISYQLDEFKPQYGGGTAIIRDSGTARGKIKEPFSGNEYAFDMSQKCRNTISADAETTFKIDSIYCRMNVEYKPVSKHSISVVENAPVKELEKPPIADIISDIENKKHAD